MAKYRTGRVRQEILREVNAILMHEVKDPRVEGVTITDVDLTGDLQEATIYYSTLSNKSGERQKTQDGLNAASGLVRSKIGQRLTLYKAPEIRFARDESVDYGRHIDELLKQVQSENPSEDDSEEESEE